MCMTYMTIVVCGEVPLVQDVAQGLDSYSYVLYVDTVIKNDKIYSCVNINISGVSENELLEKVTPYIQKYTHKITFDEVISLDLIDTLVCD